MFSGTCLTRKNQVRKCDFCDEFAGGSDNAFATRYGNSSDSRLLFGDHLFRVMPTLGQIVEGHLLITPVEHYRAIAELPGKGLEELESLFRLTRSALTQKYGNCVFFEHGMRGESSGGCGIDHAHVHAVPVAGTDVLNLLTNEFNGAKIDALTDIKTGVRGSYLFFEDASSVRYVFSVDSLPSQYMRRLVAESIGKADWDWRTIGREPQLHSTMHRLLPIFSPLVAARGE